MTHCIRDESCSPPHTIFTCSSPDLKRELTPASSVASSPSPPPPELFESFETPQSNTLPPIYVFYKHCHGFYDYYSPPAPHHHHHHHHHRYDQEQQQQHQRHHQQHQRRRSPSASVRPQRTPKEEEIAQALEIARDNPEGAAQDFYTNSLLENAIKDIWNRISAGPDSYVMTRDEFAIFNFFQHRFLGQELAVKARGRFWSLETAW